MFKEGGTLVTTTFKEIVGGVYIWNREESGANLESLLLSSFVEDNNVCEKH